MATYTSLSHMVRDYLQKGFDLKEDMLGEMVRKKGTSSCGFVTEMSDVPESRIPRFKIEYIDDTPSEVVGKDGLVKYHVGNNVTTISSSNRGLRFRLRAEEPEEEFIPIATLRITGSEKRDNLAFVVLASLGSLSWDGGCYSVSNGIQLDFLKKIGVPHELVNKS